MSDAAEKVETPQERVKRLEAELAEAEVAAGWEPFAATYMEGHYRPTVYFRRPVTITPDPEGESK